MIMEKSDSDDFLAEKISTEKIRNGDWAATNFLSPRLHALFDKLNQGVYFPIQQLHKVGNFIVGQSIRGEFSKSKNGDKHGMTALWDHKTRCRTRMLASHDTFIVAKNRKRGDDLWDRRGHLMLPARLRLPLTRTLSVFLEAPALGSAWMTFTPMGILKEENRRVREKALCVYMNSSIGILGLLGIKDSKVLCRPNFSKDSMFKFPVPNFGEKPYMDKKMAEIFEQMKERDFLPLAQIKECHVRKELDNKVADALQMEQEVMDEVRNLLSMEPSISGKRYKGLI